MNLFELTWAWYEDRESHLFVHETKTQQDFENDCKALLREHGEDYLAQEQSWAGANRWVEYVAPKLEALGYKSVEPKSFLLWGDYIIEEEDKEDSVLKTCVGEALYQKAVSHNKKIKGQMKDRRNNPYLFY